MAAIFVIPEDLLKFMLLVIVGGGLLALARWSSRLGPRTTSFSPDDAPTQGVNEPLLREISRSEGTPSAEEVAASLPRDPSLGKIRIQKFFFDKSDVSPGPDDPEVFADDLHIQLYDPDSGRSWWQSYFVATPKGLTKALHDRSWRYLYAPNILVLPKYDLEEIRKAAVSRITADNEYFKEMENEPLAEEESL